MLQPDANPGRAVNPTNPIYAYWWFHLPNLVLAALMYTVIGRFVLSFIFDPDSKNYIYRAFVRITDPVVRAVAFVTPLAVPHMVVLLFAAIWLLAGRVALYLLVASLGVAPPTGLPTQ
jgi:YggT family protein